MYLLTLYKVDFRSVEMYEIHHIYPELICGKKYILSDSGQVDFLTNF